MSKSSHTLPSGRVLLLSAPLTPAELAEFSTPDAIRILEAITARIQRRALKTLNPNPTQI